MHSKMQLVTVMVNPGKKGGRKFQIRYCALCTSAVSAHTSKIQVQQDRDWDKAATVQREEMKYLRK
jgi:hypothetical protein